MDRWLKFLENHKSGNEEIIYFGVRNTRTLVAINPANFASIEVEE